MSKPLCAKCYPWNDRSPPDPHETHCYACREPLGTQQLPEAGAHPPASAHGPHSAPGTIRPVADPTVIADGETRFATARYTARFAFAEGPFELTLRANDMLGTWELVGYDYSVEGTTFDPPYPADAEGAA